MTPQKKAALTRCANEITKYLRELQENPWAFPHAPGTKPRPLDCPSACRNGNRVRVQYLIDCRPWDLTRDEATCYLRWLRKGNVGKHWNAVRAQLEAA